MIEPGDGWRFRDTHAENALFNDQHVDHVVTGAIVQRRVFLPKVMRCEPAVELIRAHAERIAARKTPVLPALVVVETVQDHLCVYTQMFNGEPLEVLLRRGNPSTPKRWAMAALRLVRLCEALEQDGAGFENLNLRDVVDCRGVLAVARWAPIGAAPGEALAEHEIVRRLSDPALGGAIAHEGKIPLREGMQNLKDLLFQLALGKAGARLEDELGKAGGSLSAHGSGLGIELPIEKALMRLHEPEKPNGIRNLEALEDLLDSMLPDRPKAWVRPAPDRSAGVQLAAEDEAKEAPALPEREKADRAEELTPFLKASIQEDAEEDRSYLYPGRKDAATGEESDPYDPESALFHDAKERSARTAQRDTTWIKPGLIGVVLLAVVIGGYFVVTGLVTAPQPNERPTAAFTLDAPQVLAYETANLDGSASSDPEGERLRYTWRVDDVPRTEYRFSAPQDPATTVQFFSPGEYTIRLEVWDGLNTAEATETISVLEGGEGP